MKLRQLPVVAALHALPKLHIPQAPLPRCSYGSFLLRDLPFDAIEFVSYEVFKSRCGVQVQSATAR